MLKNEARSRLTASMTAISLAAFGLAAVLVAAADSAPRTGSSEHLVVVPNTGEGRAALAQTTAREVAGYESFTLVEAAGKDLVRLVDAGASVRDDMREVRLRGADVDPTKGRVSLTAKGGGAAKFAKAGRGLTVVQFVGPVKDEWLDAVRKTGARLVTYMAQNAELVAGTTAQLDEVAALAGRESFIRAVTPYEAADKLTAAIARTGSVQAVVSTVAGADGDGARASVAKSSTPRGDAVTIGAITQQRVQLDGAAVDSLAGSGGVVAIEPFTDPKLHDERAAQIVGGNINASFQPVLGGGYLAFLASRGFPATLPVSIDVTDEGIDKGVVPVPAGSHPDFYRSGNPANPSRLIYAHENTAADANARDCGGHGTNVASIASGYNATTAGTDQDAGGFNYGLGVAPSVNVGATKIFNCAGSFDVTTSFTALHGSAYASGARISNNSWGAPVNGAYNADSRELDSLVRDARPGTAGNQQFTEVFSAGNSGSGPDTIGSPGTGKNVLTVGAAENVRAIGGSDGCGVPDTGANSARDIIDFSSRGPTDDGRTKPDVVAPGTHVSGARPTTGADFTGSGTCNPTFPAGNTKYTLVSGTSQAAPEVTGLSALVHDWWRRGPGAGSLPSPAMNKAIIVNGASDVVGGQDGAGGTLPNVPTQVAGWGRVNLGTITNGHARQFVNQTKVFATTGATHNVTYAIADAARPLRVTLAYTDAPGPTTGNAFVNDLDLEVIAGGSTYKGNVLVAGKSVTGGSADPRNNLENVLLPTGLSGPIGVRVVGRNIAGDGVPGNADSTDQDYALVVSNVVPATAPIFAHDVGQVLTQAPGGGDGDGSIEPGETALLREKLRNVGNQAATGITSVLSAAIPAQVSIAQASSAFPNLGINASALSTSQYRFTIAPSVPCGTAVGLRLAVSSTQTATPQTVSFSLPPSGVAGAGVARNSTNVPKPIADSATTTSTLTVPAGAGTVADVNARLTNITHTFTSDLEIVLRSPAGTEVKLFDNHGGSGDNITNLVLDDEAPTALGGQPAPFTGTFRPSSDQLSRFDGQPVSGTWTLKIADQVAADTGTLSGWGHTIAALSC